jgi:small subunit ribosomal protein S17
MMSEVTNSGGEATAMEGGAAARSFLARVVSARMDKSASVEIVRTVRHSLYGKYLRRRTKLLVHDEGNECREGDTVRIVASRPISKRKAWRMVEIVERAPEEPGRAETGEAAGERAT